MAPPKMPSGNELEIVDRLARIEEQIINLVKIETQRGKDTNNRIDNELGRAAKIHEDFQKDIDNLWKEVRRLRQEWENARSRLIGALIGVAGLGGLIGSGLASIAESIIALAGGN